MPQAHPLISSFNAGEWSSSMEGRVDLENYRQSCRLMENFICLPQGPAMTRPGFRFVNEVKDSADITRLIPFIHSNQQTYIIEAGDLYFRFYMAQARILSAGVPYEIVTPFTSAQLQAIQGAQSADVMYLCHNSHAQQKLSRTGHAAWTITSVAFNDGPYLDQNTDQAIHLVPSATTGNGITITASNMYTGTYKGTWDGTAGAGPAIFLTAASPFVIVVFEASKGKLQSVTVNITTPAGGAVNATAYLYASDGAKAIGSALATSDAIDLATDGEKTFTFSTMPDLISGDKHAIVFGIAAPDAAIRADTIANMTSYISGYAAAATDALTPLAANAEYKIKISYQPTADPSVFQADHVGSRWRLKHTGQSTTSTFTATGNGTAKKILGKFTTNITVNTAWIGRLALQRSSNQVTWHDVATFSTSSLQEFTELQTGVYYRIVCKDFSAGSATASLTQVEHWGIFEVATYVNAYTITADVIADLGSTDPSPFWREAAWSDVRGYPRTVCFHDDRLIFAGSTYQPLTVWASDVGDYEQFSPDSDALTFTLAKLTSAIQWINSAQALAVGTLGEEANLATRKEEAMTATNPPFVDIQSTFGSQLNTVPLAAGPALLFIQAGGRQLRQFLYNLSTNKFIADDLTFLADHITAGGIVELAYQQTPHSILWGRTATGELVGCTYARIGEDISKGWHRHPSDGVLKSIAVIPSGFGAAESRHELWALWQRTVQGVAKQYVEVLADNYEADQEDYFCVDSGLSYSGVAVTGPFALDHLIGEKVSIFADGAIIGSQYVPVSGDIYLDEAAADVHIGLPFTCQLMPQRLEAGAQDGVAQGRKMEFGPIKLRLKDAIGGKIGSTEANALPISDYISSIVAGIAPSLFTGDTDRIPWPGDTTDSGDILIIQEDPAPMTVLAILPEIVTND